MNTHLNKALEILGGSQTALAREIGVSQPYVHKMLKTGRVSAKQCRAIERATRGEVTAEQLRPDIFGPVDSAA